VTAIWIAAALLGLLTLVTLAAAAWLLFGDHR